MMLELNIVYNCN